MNDFQREKKIALQLPTSHSEATPSLAAPLSRRDLLHRAGQGVLSLTALSLLNGGAVLGALASDVKRGKNGSVRALSASPDLNQQQLPLWNDVAGWNQPQYYETMQLADIDGDGQDELLIRGPYGISVQRFDLSAQQWVPLPGQGPDWSDDSGWNQPRYYTSIQCADVDGDGAKEILARDVNGLVGYKYDKATQTWNTLAAGPDDFADGHGWGEPEYYATIHYGDIDGDGAAELIARSASGIWALKYTPGGWNFLLSGPAWVDDPKTSSDGTQWNLPQYYETIQLADIDGDGWEELIGRSRTGVQAWKYLSTGWEYFVFQDGFPWSDADGWTQPRFYTTIQCADIDGDGAAEILARAQEGIVGYKTQKNSKNIFVLPTDGPGWSDASGVWNQAPYYSTIKFGDVSGDGRAELIGRDQSGIQTFGYSPANQTWDRLNNNVVYSPQWADDGSTSDSNATNWNQVEYYSTLRLGDIDGDGIMELVARDKYSVQTWKVRKKDATWQKTTASFPDYLSKDTVSLSIRNAYTYINTSLRGSFPEGEFRSVYYDLTAPLDRYYLGLKDLTPPSNGTTSAADWTIVKTQILSELKNAINVNSWYGEAHSIITDTFLSNDLTLTDIGNQQLNIPAASTAKTLLSVLSIMSAMTRTVLSVNPEYKAAAGIAGLLGTAFSTAASHLPNGGNAYQEAYNQLAGKLNSAFQEALVANGANQVAAMKDYSQLSAIGSLVDEGEWRVEDDQHAPIVKAGQRSYATSIYQMLTPLVWKINADDGTSFYGVYNPYTVQRSLGKNNQIFTFFLTKTGRPSSISVSTLQHLFDQPMTANPGASDPLGLSIRDAVNRTNDWSIPYESNAPYVGGAIPWTPEPNLAVQVTVTRNVAASQIMAAITVQNSGVGPGTPATNVEIVGAQLGGENTLTALPLPQTYLAEYTSHTLTLPFPLSAGRSGQTVVLRVQGKYKGGTFGGSFRVKLL